MAGGVSGNLKPLWSRIARSEKAYNDAVDEAMKIFLAGCNGRNWVFDEYAETFKDVYKPYVLESFYYADEDIERLIPYFGDFLLDSGAFTFMEQTGSADWDEYAERYAAFIRKNNIQKYIELDLDYIIGVEGARKLRTYLERETGRQSVPVWHPIRGISEFKKMCDEYPYVCLGGIVGKKWRGMEQYMPWFIREAHRRGAKIHGLGFTQLTKLPEYHFDSVDSTAWTTGNRFGYIYRFDGKTMRKISAPSGHKLGDPRKAALHNYSEWIKFQKYADTHF